VAEEHSQGRSLFLSMCEFKIALEKALGLDNSAQV